MTEYRLVKNIVIIADENLYDIFIRKKIDILQLEKIESQIGSIFLTNDVAAKLNDKVTMITYDSQTVISWRKKMHHDNSKFLEFLQKNTSDVNRALESIREHSRFLKQVLKKFDCGSTSNEDLEIFASALWIGMNTPFIPFLVSDDDDLLGFGHMIASYMGFPIIISSIYELLAAARDYGTLGSYCEYSKIPLPGLITSSCPFPIMKFGTEFPKYFNAGKVALHPKWSGRSWKKDLFSK